MTKKGKPLAGAADLQRKLTRMAQAGHGDQAEAPTEEAVSPSLEDAPTGRTKRRRTSRSPTSRRRPLPRRMAKPCTMPADVEAMLAEGRTEEAMVFIMEAMSEDSTGSRHVQVRMPGWLHREWSIYVARQGREVREVLLSIILGALAQEVRDGDA